MGKKSIPEKNKDMDPKRNTQDEPTEAVDPGSTSNPDAVSGKITGLEPGGGVPPGETPPGEGSMSMDQGHDE